jgi:hypothetical protein
LRTAGQLRAENPLEPLRGRFLIRRAQMDVIPGKGRHGVSPFSFLSCPGLTRASMKSVSKQQAYGFKTGRAIMDCRVKPGNDSGVTCKPRLIQINAALPAALILPCQP